MKKIKLLIIIIVFQICITGCWDENIYEKVGFMLQDGIELTEDNKLLVTYTVPIIGEKKGEVEVISNKVNLLRESREDGVKQSSRYIQAGKMQQLLFSKELAKESGIHNIVEIFERDPANPVLAFIVVVDGSPKTLLEEAQKFKNKPMSAFYINELIEQNIKNSYTPETRIYNFDIDYFAPGIDPIAPMIKLGKNCIKVVGTALFSKDKMVGNLNTKQTSLLLTMMNKGEKMYYMAKAESLFKNNPKGKSGIAIGFRNPKSKINIEFKDNKPVVNIDLKFNGSLREYEWNRLQNESAQKNIEKILSKEMQKDCVYVIKYCQEVGSDPIGIGNIVRAKYNDYWNNVNWKEEYKHMKVNIKVHVNIIEYGVID